MYAKQGLMLREENIVGSEDTQSVWATLLSGNGSKTTIGLCYVPPNDRESDVKLHRIWVRFLTSVQLLKITSHPVYC